MSFHPSNSAIHSPFQSYPCAADNLNFPKRMAKNSNIIISLQEAVKATDWNSMNMKGRLTMLLW